jgi:hypothetical protein
MQGEPAQSLGDRLHAMAHALPEEGITVAQLVRSLGREGLLLLAIALCIPFLLPVSIPGVSTVFGALILFIGLSEALAISVWLPERIGRYSLTRARMQSILELGSRWVMRLARWSEPRYLALTEGRMCRVNGALLVLAAGLLMLPLAFIPFSNTLPAAAAIFLSAGMLNRDGRALAVGVAALVLSVIYFGLIFYLGAGVLTDFASRFSGYSIL